MRRTAVAAAHPSAVSVDWSQRVIDSNLNRIPDPAKFGNWGYPQGLFLMGQYLVYRRTKSRHPLDYIIGFVNTHIDKMGNLDQPIEALDDVLSANLLVILYEETHEQRYKLVADKFRHRFDTYPGLRMAGSGTVIDRSANRNSGSMATIWRFHFYFATAAPSATQPTPTTKLSASCLSNTVT